MIRIFENFEVNNFYIIGIPSGQIIDIYYKDINNLKQRGLLRYDNKLRSYIFKDEFYEEILKILKLPIPGKSIPYNIMDDVLEFLDTQKLVRAYRSTSDGVEITGSIFINKGSYRRFPIVFKEVTGDFTFKNCGLETLNKGPLRVGGNFNVSYNNLTDLIGGPQYVGMSYDCSYNDIVSLKGSPDKIRGNFNCSYNNLRTFNGGPKSVAADLNCTGNKNLINIEGPSAHRLLTDRNIKMRYEGDGKCRW